MLKKNILHLSASSAVKVASLISSAVARVQRSPRGRVCGTCDVSSPQYTTFSSPTSPAPPRDVPRCCCSCVVGYLWPAQARSGLSAGLSQLLLEDATFCCRAWRRWRLFDRLREENSEIPDGMSIVLCWLGWGSSAFRAELWLVEAFACPRRRPLCRWECSRSGPHAHGCRPIPCRIRLSRGAEDLVSKSTPFLDQRLD